ncbi:protein of unknown function [Legionella hackeliae]|uniref:Uncharacterized protein n=1 Tax=Legionella hackeliae TaxID=449 RepID=A0A0A8UN43_LEGHA|nr:protein of unknown function [Legionella hackeliae]
MNFLSPKLAGLQKQATIATRKSNIAAFPQSLEKSANASLRKVGVNNIAIKERLRKTLLAVELIGKANNVAPNKIETHLCMGNL